MTTPTLHPAYPWYLGGGGIGGDISETGPDAGKWIPKTVTLDGYSFLVDLKNWQSGPLDTFRDALAPNAQPNDTLFDAKGAWARYKFSWHHGRGQALGDLDDTADTFRFEDSDRIAWHTKYQLTLQHSTTKTQAAASGTPLLCRSDIYVYLSDGANLYRTIDLTTWSAMTAPGGTVNAMTTDGTDLYVATTTAVVKYVGAATVGTAFATPVAAADSIAFCSGRLLVGMANILKEVAGSGAVTVIKTHFQAAFRWTTIFNIGSRIYVGGFAGSRSELHTLATDSVGALVQSQEAAPLPIGEKLRTGISFSGAAVLCTSSGIRVADVSGDGTLTYGPLINEPGDVQCACADAQYVFAGWSSMDGTRSGVVRLILDEEVRALQPAYSNDVSEPTTIAAVTGVARLGGRTCFAVTGSGAWSESATTYEGQGSVDSGQIFFGTVEPKKLVSLDLAFQPLLTGQSVKGEVRDQAGVLIADGVQSTVDSQALHIDLEGADVVSCEVTVILLGPGTSTPKLSHWRMRSFPVPPEVIQWILPLVVKEQYTVGIGEGVIRSLNIPDMHIWAETLHATRRQTVLRINEREYVVRLEKFEWHPESWDKSGDGPQGVLIVQLIATA